MPIRRRGRPKKSGFVDPKPPTLNREVDKAADEIAKKRILPQPPGKKISFEEMQEYFKLLTPEMWSHVALYLYREYPRIIRQLKDAESPRYIDCLSQPFDMDYMIEHHGGGTYHVTAVDTEHKFGSSGNRIFECNFEISPTQHEPKLNYEELDVNAKANMAYISKLQYRGILDNKGHIVTPQAPPNPGTNPDVIREVLQFVQTMNADQQEALKARIAGNEQQTLTKSVGDILIEKMRQDDPAKQFTGLAGMLKEVLAMNRPADGASQVLEKVFAIQNDNNNRVFAMQSDYNKTVLALFEKLSEASRKPDAPPVNPQIEQLEQIFSFAERLSGLRHGGRGGERNGWEIGLDYAKEIGVPVLQQIGNWMSLSRTGRPMPPVTPGGEAAGAAIDPYRDQAAMRALSRQQAQNQNVAAQPPPQAQPTPASELAGLVQMYGTLVVQHLNTGTPGHEFADYVTALFGTAVHSQISAQGEPAIVQALMSVPEIAMFGEARLRKFVHEFVHYAELLEQEPEDEDDQDDQDPDNPILRPAADGRERRA